MSGKEFLGTGMKFPPQIDPGTGRFALASGDQSVRESVYLILMTGRTERWLVPDFGSTLSAYTFMDMSPTMLQMMTDEIQTTLTQQEPRIEDVTVEVEPEVKDGCMLVDISYRVKATNASGNLVFPFYLNAAREELG